MNELKAPASIESFKASLSVRSFVIAYDANATDISSFMSLVEDNDNVLDHSASTNKGCLSAADGTVIHNMHDTQTCIYRGLAARRHKYPYSEHYDYQQPYKTQLSSDGTQLGNGIRSITQSQGTIYALDSLSPYGHSYVNDELYSWLCRTNGYAFPPMRDVYTALYGKSTLSASYEALSCLDGIKYNTLYEIPSRLAQDPSSGTVFATAVKCKNQYDHQYTMRHSLSTALSCARDYFEINSCNGLTYALYYDRKNYEANGAAHKNHQPCLSANDSSPLYGYQLPHVEVLKNLNRGATAADHKSSLYSIDIQALFLSDFNARVFDDVRDEDEKAAMKERVLENIKSEIKNCVRQIVQKLAPANTQLFAVTVH